LVQFVTQGVEADINLIAGEIRPPINNSSEKFAIFLMAAWSLHLFFLVSLLSFVFSANVFDTRYPSPTGSIITSISYGDSKFLATGMDGTLLSSDTGASWSVSSSPVQG